MTSIRSSTASVPTGSRPPAASAHPARDAVAYIGIVAVMVVAIALTLGTVGEMAPLVSMATPVVAVGLMTFLFTPRGSRRAMWSTFGLRHAGWRSWPAAFVGGVLTVFVVPFGIAAALGSAAFVSLSSIDVPQALINLPIMLGMVTLMAMAEEIGWRSYLLPRMQQLFPRRSAALVVGFVHGLFHVPLIVLTDTYNSVGSRWIVVPIVVLALTCAGVFYAWLKDRSGSVWPVAFAHATVNVFIDGLGVIVILSPVALAYTATESGFATLAAIGCVAAVLLVRGGTWDDRR